MIREICTKCKKELVWIPGENIGEGVYLHVIRWQEGGFVMATLMYGGHAPIVALDYDEIKKGSNENQLKLPINHELLQGNEKV